MNRHIHIIGLVAILLSLLACEGRGRSSQSNLDAGITAYADDGKIDPEEYRAIRVEAGSNYSEEELRDHILSVAPEVEIIGDSNEETAELNEPRQFAVFLENSGSMYGYMSGNTEFKRSLLDLITRFNGRGDVFTPYFINRVIKGLDGKEAEVRARNTQKIAEKINQFKSYLNNSGKLYQLGGGGSTDLVNVINTVFDTVKNREITGLLVSDYIYSLKGNKKMADELAEQKYITKAIFQEARNVGVATLVIKMSSAFKGNYYYHDAPNQGVPYEGNRPYYIFIFGQHEVLQNFPKDYRIQEGLDGYVDHFMLSDREEYNKAFTVLKTTQKVGRFRPQPRSGVVHTALDKVRPSQRNGESELSFSVAVDLSGLPVPASYLLDANNYGVIQDGSDFIIKDILPIDAADGNDERQIKDKPYTHILVVSGSDIVQSEAKLILALTRQIPNWVASSSTDNDRKDSQDELSNRTFGLNYLIEGVWEGYYGEATDQYYATWTVNLNS